MGLTGFARKYLRQKYARAFSYTKMGTAQVVIYDLMQDIKYLPPDITNLRHALKFFLDRFKSHFYQDGVEVGIILVDRKPLEVKRAITHKKRYGKVTILDPKDGPYLPKRMDESINLKGEKRPWIEFAGSYKNLQRELYPLLFNAIMSGEFLVPRPWQKLYLHGFPGFCEYVRGEEVVHAWRPDLELPITEKMEEQDPDLYNRVFLIEHIPPCAEYREGKMFKVEVPKMKNDISEADAGMFFYDHFFQDKSIMFLCNDGDLFSYGLLYAQERVDAQNVFRNIHYGCLPYKIEDEDDKDIFPEGKKPPYEYIDFNLFYILVNEDMSMNMAGVQNHAVTLVFLLILAESDYFKDYAKGIGKESVIWSVFRYNMSMFSHMVQLSKGFEGSTRTPRRIVIDEDCFRIFIHYCYVEKYGTSVRKTLKKEKIEYKDIETHTKNLKKARDGDEEYKLPSRNKIRLWARQIDYNFHLVKNAHISGASAPDPYQLHNSLPLYPYSRTEGVIKAVSVKRPPVDEVYEQHFIKNKKTKPAVISEEKKKNIVELLGDNKK